MDNNSLKIIFKKIIYILKNMFYQIDNNLSTYNKLNVFMNNTSSTDKTDYLIQIKPKYIFHILGFHYWKKLTNTNDIKVKNYLFIKKFINKSLAFQNPYQELEKIVINNWSKLDIDIRSKYSSNDFFVFLIQRFKIFVDFIELIYANQSTTFYLCNDNKNYFLMWDLNKQKMPQIVLKKISNTNYQYETYIPISIKSIPLIIKNNIININLNRKKLKIRNIKPFLILNNNYWIF
ncbi:Uncharacterised protein (plasmid) [Mycoplasmopsis maculosa]|uniref:Uncharacterized protein n=1 Tax=Mycoplasmopsis maculosa TaxID=114885 RepID=A0A449B3Y7_9BACT|nr:hypothetical protein [Mycoplasmopsis maculosa]VEU75307.1 Uncharacterised protein [Mycoplasmopsis maculosa]VEU75836.1 Uncharacterised protein [Mycoplasmopsis maculosa]